MSETADISHDAGGRRRVLRFAGNLTLLRVRKVSEELKQVQDEALDVDISDVERMDTVGAWLIHKLQRDHGARVIGASAEQQLLLDQVAKADTPMQVRAEHEQPMLRLVAEVGEATKTAMSTMLGLIGFFGSLCMSAWHLIRHPRRFRFNAVVTSFDMVGVRALAIIGLMSFLVGVVIAQQGAVQLRQFGAEVYTINLIGRLTFRELGILMTAIMVAGRSGSAFAAQLGSMKLAEEVDAMRTIGVSPMEALVLPRVLSTVLLMPLLGFYASIVALIGGGLLCWISLDIPPITYVQRIREVVPMTDLWSGLIKAPVFGMIIAMAGCYQGLQVRGDAEEVGMRTTAAVVQGIFLVIVLDAFFAVFFTEIGWV
ncbi:ABC transporter permease [Sphingosinicella sp. LHD-64]|uniref:ABC transporter permease n=1 Tax=Sphingosinicella sp. LHD-64 TaxID=3072139 RepID=UPI00280DC8DB|nr:ABC transporter permease [Sphingosinicella sp. LHD-64]MDQ8758331.1 ABC transporter permease [Sphingosinicella sp. LHD-64]